MLPSNPVLTPQRDFGDLFARWRACNASQIQLLDTKDIARSEDRPDVME